MTALSRAVATALCALLMANMAVAATPNGSVTIPAEVREQLASFDLSSTEPVDVIVKLSGTPAALVSSSERPTRLNQIQTERGNLFSQLRRNGINVSPRHQFDQVFVGFSLTLPANQLPVLAAVPGVIGIYENVEIQRETAFEDAVMNVRPELATSVPAVKAPAAWSLGYRGQGIVVGILDDGVDWTHPDLGGCLGAGCKVIAGYDFIDLDADPNNGFTKNATTGAMERDYHGSHVASTAAGLKGVAPEAKIVAARVLGTNATGKPSNLSNVMAGIEYAVRNEVDVINMSIGLINAYGQSTNLWTEMTANVVRAGIVWVNSNGNDGPTTYRANMYGSSPEVIATGNADARGANFPRTQVVATGEVLLGGAYGVEFPSTILNTPVDVVHVGFGNTQAYYAGKNVAGKIALVLRGGATGEDANFTNKADQARIAGAAGIIIYNDAARSVDFTTSELSLPSFTLSYPNAQKVIANPRVTISSFAPGAQMASGSSRGPTFDLMIKPDVSAPGTGIVAAVPFQASSTGYASLNGTSMAAPHVAGAAALLRQARPDWTPAQVKAALMNSAKPMKDLFGNTFRPIDQGSGLIDVERALATTLRVTSPSLSYGQVMPNNGYTATKTLTVEANGTYNISSFFTGSPAGATVATSTPAVSNGTSNVNVTVSINPSAPAGEYQGYVVFTNTADATDVYGVPFLFVHNVPVSDMKLSKTIARSSSNPALADNIVVTFNAGRQLAEWWLGNSTGSFRFTPNQPATAPGPVSYNWNVRQSNGGTITGSFTFTVWYRLPGQSTFTAAPVYRIFIDNDAPLIGLDGPLPTLTTSREVTVRGAVADVGMFTWGEVGGKVLVNGEPADLFPRAPTVVFQGPTWNSELAFDKVITLAEGQNSVTIYAEDAAGNRSTQTFTLTTTLDTIAPVITFTGAGNYTVDQTVTVTCTATDATSGVATTTCGGAPLLSSDGWALPLGPTTVTATATDVAGNSASASATVTVGVTFNSLRNIAVRFAGGALGNSLAAKLDAASDASARGNVSAANAQLGAFQSEVQAQSGKAIAANLAQVLVNLAEALKK